MTHSLHHVASARFALCTNHGSTLIDATQSLSQILGTTHKGYLELPLVDMIYIIGRTEHLALVDVVYLYSLQNLCFGEVSNAALGHHGNAHSLLNALYHLGVTHAAHATSRTYVGRNALQGHHSTCTCLLRNSRLLRSRYIHNHSAF